ncbi:hypothetical protein [Kiloniella antarctica]|uniref:Solute-binding protein family 3/N-terminal domain-containing protein n=1 Tax=Kiloniella antarctica TaxID=1550907 RepID=A0ABW5BQ09_9PROT
MKFLILFFLCFYTNQVLAQTVYTTRAPESPNDKRQDYTIKLLELALEKTKSKYGSYKLEFAPLGSNIKRSLADARQGKYENFFVRNSVSLKNVDQMAAVPFPVDLGIVGYRVAFTSEGTKALLNSVKNLEDLKKFNIVQGFGWLDTKILKSHDLQVESVSSYEGMFKMVANGRVDLFTRGVNELLEEWIAHQHIPNLAYDESFTLYYPLPRFFFTAKENKEAAQRIHEGLIIAYEDGSLIELWEKSYGPSITFANLNSRRYFEIDNPFLEGLDDSYKKYIYRPLE